jgi:hypothetical protein
MRWVENPPDRTGFEISILPPSFNTNSDGCVLCGHTLDVRWECTGCGADHFPAVQLLIKKRGAGK